MEPTLSYMTNPGAHTASSAHTHNMTFEAKSPRDILHEVQTQQDDKCWIVEMRKDKRAKAAIKFISELESGVVHMIPFNAVITLLKSLFERMLLLLLLVSPARILSVPQPSSDGVWCTRMYLHTYIILHTTYIYYTA